MRIVTHVPLVVYNGRAEWNLAGRRFGADTGDELAALLSGVEDGAELERIGALIIECGNGPDFLARARTR